MNIIAFRKQSKLVKKRELKGIWFVLPFVIGFFAFILVPMVTSFIYSFNEIKFDGKVILEFVGLGNFKRAFLVDTDFRQILLSSLSDMLTNVPIILIFSMLISVFLSGEFPGQPIFQIIFFIPIILSAGIMPSLFSEDTVRQTIINASSMTGEDTSVFNASYVSDILLKLNINSSFVNYIQYAIENILEVLNSSGIQILVFLIGIKAIPRSLYEASSIEGATSWETFWKITFPMLFPQLVVNLIYTIIDSVSNNVNPVMVSITNYNFKNFEFGYAASLAWVYFAVIVVLLLLAVGMTKLISKHYN